MKIIEITEDKVSKLSEHIEQGLRHVGKAMQCVESMMEDYGERGGMGYREYSGSRYGSGHHTQRYGERYPMYGYRDEDWDDDDEMNERRGRRRRDSRGRYM